MSNEIKKYVVHHSLLLVWYLNTILYYLPLLLFELCSNIIVTMNCYNIFFNKSSEIHQTHADQPVNTFVTLHHFHTVHILILERKMLCRQWFFFSFTSFLKHIYHTIKPKSYKLPSLKSIAKASGWSQQHHRNRIHSVTHLYYWLGCVLLLCSGRCVSFRIIIMSVV